MGKNMCESHTWYGTCSQNIWRHLTSRPMLHKWPKSVKSRHMLHKWPMSIWKGAQHNYGQKENIKENHSEMLPWVVLTTMLLSRKQILSKMRTTDLSHMEHKGVQPLGEESSVPQRQSWEDAAARFHGCTRERENRHLHQKVNANVHSSVLNSQEVERVWMPMNW